MTKVPGLTEAEFEELDGFLVRVDGGEIPNTEALDGFFAALACCPDLAMPSEYMPTIRRGRTEDGDLVFESPGGSTAIYGDGSADIRAREYYRMTPSDTLIGRPTRGRVP